MPEATLHPPAGTGLSSSARAMRVERISPSGDVVVRDHDGDAPALRCRVLAPVPGTLRHGDEVLVLPGEGDRGFVLGRLAARAEVLAAVAPRTEPGHASDQETLRLRDAAGHTVLECGVHDGRAVLRVARGDLDLEAPAGSIRLAAGRDVEIVAGRELGATAPAWRPVHRRCDARIEAVDLRGASLDVGFERVTVQASRVETLADRVVERCRDALRFVENLQQSTIGRLRTVVRGALSLRAGRADVRAEEDVRIDGEKIHLG